MGSEKENILTCYTIPEINLSLKNGQGFIGWWLLIDILSSNLLRGTFRGLQVSMPSQQTQNSWSPPTKLAPIPKNPFSDGDTSVLPGSSVKYTGLDFQNLLWFIPPFCSCYSPRFSHWSATLDPASWIYNASFCLWACFWFFPNLGHLPHFLPLIEILTKHQISDLRSTSINFREVLLLL